MTHRLSPTGRPSPARLLRAGSAAATLALVGTVVLFIAARLAGLLTVAPDAGGATPGAPGLFAIVGMTLAAPTVATILLAGLVRFVPRPGMAFGAVAATVFAGFFVGPLTLGATVPLTAVLEAMHLVVAAPVVVALLGTLPPRDGRRPPRSTDSAPSRRPA